MRSLVFSNDPKAVWEKKWLKNGRLHRGKLLPAVYYFEKDIKFFYIDGDYCSIQGDLLFSKNFITWKNGTKEHRNFYFAGLKGTIKDSYFLSPLHRSHNLPAIEYSNGDKEYWVHGYRHRIDGPAVIYGNKQYWFIKGEFIKCTR